MNEQLLVRDVQPGDLAALLVLNNDAVPAVNPHTEETWAALLAEADRTWVVEDADGQLGGMLVTYAPGAGYESANYRWLSERFEQFRYVDRIVTAPTHRRMGVGGLLYGALGEHAMAQDAPVLLCEVNVEPANPVSIAFHESQGWQAIDDLQHAPGKVVRFFQRPL